MGNRIRRWILQSSDALHLVPMLMLLWYALTGGDAWPFGVTAVVIVAWLGYRLTPIDPLRLSLSGLLRFVGYFLYRSILGGLDVAWRALHPRMPLEIDERSLRLDFPASQQRTVFVSTVSLLPGTLSCDLIGDRLHVHSIAGDPRRELALLERHVRALFRGPRQAPRYGAEPGP